MELKLGLSDDKSSKLSIRDVASATKCDSKTARASKVGVRARV